MGTFELYGWWMVVMERFEVISVCLVMAHLFDRWPTVHGRNVNLID